MKAILYVVDALRADHLSCYGYHRNTSPNIDDLADDSFLFSNAQSQSTWTRASAGAILTGMYPPSNGLESMFDHLPGDVTTLSEHLSSAGVKTLGVSAMGNVSSTFGFDSAFDEFIDVYKHPDLLREKETIHSNKLFMRAGEDDSVVNPTSGDLNDFVIPWIKEHADEDFFILIWSIDPHDPYDPLEDFRKYSADQETNRVPGYSDLSHASSADEVRWIKNRYDDLIRQNDHFIGELCGSLQEIGIYNETLFTLTGDHGESFGENGVFGHATTPTEPVTNIPLILKLPGKNKSSATISDIVGHIDIFPTISSAFGKDYSESIQGCNLLPVLNEKEKLSRNMYSRTKLNERVPEYLSVITDDYKYISVRAPEIKDILEFTINPMKLYSIVRTVGEQLVRSEKEYLFEISERIDEKNNLADENRATSENLAEEIHQWMKECKEINESLESVTAEIDAETKGQLKQMGYIE